MIAQSDSETKMEAAERRMILSSLRAGMTIQQAAKDVGISARKISLRLNEYRERGLIPRDRGRYQSVIVGCADDPEHALKQTIRDREATIATLTGSLRSERNKVEALRLQLATAEAKIAPVLPPFASDEPIRVMEYIPDELPELAEWLLGLNPDQMERVWVQAVIEYLPIGQKGWFARAFNVIRARYREKIGHLKVEDKATLNPGPPRGHGPQAQYGKTADTRAPFAP